MTADRRPRDEEPIRDLPCRQPVPETIEDVPFARRQVVLVSADEARLPRTVAEFFDQPGRQRPRERSLAVEDVAQRRAKWLLGRMNELFLQP